MPKVDISLRSVVLIKGIIPYTFTPCAYCPMPSLYCFNLFSEISVVSARDMFFLEAFSDLVVNSYSFFIFFMRIILRFSRIILVS